MKAKDTKFRFDCPKCGTQMKPRGNPSGGRFHGCDACYEQGGKLTIEWDPPHRAYGDMAEALGILGQPQMHGKEVPTARKAKELQREEDYQDIIIDGWEFRLNFLELKKRIVPRIQAIGGKYKKLSLDEIRHDIEALAWKN